MNPFIAILSPAKSLHTKTQVSALQQPIFLQKSAEINAELRKKSPSQLMDLQSISNKLAELNADRNLHWSVEGHQEATPAMFTFTGDVYQGLDAETLDAESRERAKESLVILSGLYGILRPYDAILPYRLEMGTKISINDSADLYAFWKNEVTNYFNQTYSEKTLINLASNEYASVIDRKNLRLPVLEITFKDFSKGDYKIISFHAKKARGLYARFLVEKNPQSLNDLQLFDYGGYSFSSELSNTNQLVFLRS